MCQLRDESVYKIEANLGQLVIILYFVTFQLTHIIGDTFFECFLQQLL